MSKQDVILGCDPEAVWLMDGTGYKGMLPAGIVLNRLEKVGSDLITGDYKGYPCIETDDGLIFADGAGWELNPHPGDTSVLLNNISGLLKTSQQVERELETNDRHIRLDIRSSVSFNLDMLDVWQDEQLSQFGCDPDASIWPRQVDPRKIDASTHQYRYFGGHIHLGFPLDNPEEFYKDTNNLRRMVVLADGILGVVGIIIDSSVNSGAHTRRKVYGQPGVYRPQPHGIEYRTLSNTWMLSRTFARNMLTLASFLPALFDTDMPEYLFTKGKEIRRILIRSDRMPATRFLASLKDMVEDAEWQKAVDWAISRGRMDYPRHPDWKTSWRIYDDK